MSTPDPHRLQPPDDLEARVIARLRDAGLLSPTTTNQETDMKTIHLRWGLAATLLLLFGVYTGTQIPGPGAVTAPAAVATADPRPAFALMLYEDGGYQAPVDDAAHAARVAEYSAWAGRLAEQGRLVDAAELLDRGVLLHRDRPRSHGVPTSNEGLLAGYFVVRADSLEDAERIAADCPHLAHGGTVSVRPTGA